MSNNKTTKHSQENKQVSQMIASLKRKRVIHADQFKIIRGWCDRTCRMIANDSGGLIISTNDGYVLNERATDAEYSQAYGRINNQADKMKIRAAEIEAGRARIKYVEEAG